MQVEREGDRGKNDGKDSKDNYNSFVYDHFGWSVSLHRSTLVVGAYGDGTMGISAGAAYVFNRQDDKIYGWTCTQKLLPSDGSDYDSFGWSVSNYDNITVVGAYGHSSSDMVFNGAVYIFQRFGTNHEDGTTRLLSWSQTTVLLPIDASSNDFFGWNVAVWNNLVAVGSHHWQNHESDDSPKGAVYTYSTANFHVTSKSVTEIHLWHLDEKLLPKDSSTRYFGNSISMSDKTLVVGAVGQELSTNHIGRAFIYVAKEMPNSFNSIDTDDEVYNYDITDENNGDWRPLYTWVFKASLLPNTTESGIQFGFSVDIDEATALVGAVRADGQAADTGAAYVFIKSNTKFEYPMSERTYLALVSFLPFFFLSVFCVIMVTMACMKLKASAAFMTLVDLQDDDNDEFEDSNFDATAHSTSTMDSSVYSETELIGKYRRHNIDHF